MTPHLPIVRKLCYQAVRSEQTEESGSIFVESLCHCGGSDTDNPHWRRDGNTCCWLRWWGWPLLGPFRAGGQRRAEDDSVQQPLLLIAVVANISLADFMEGIDEGRRYRGVWRQSAREHYHKA